MGFTVGRAEFADAVSAVGRVLPARPLNPVLAAVRLVGDESGLKVEAFDYEVAAAATVDGTTVAEGGETLVSGRLLAAIAKALPKRVPVKFTHDGARAVVQAGAAEFTLPTMDPREFPQLPGLPTEAGIVDGDLLAEALAQVLPAVHTEGNVPAIAGVQFEFGADVLVLRATDRYRVAVREVPFTWSAGATAEVGTRVTVPTRALGEVGRLGDGSIAVGLAGTLSLTGPALSVVSQLVGEDFPDVSRVFPAEHTAVAVFDAGELAEALGRVLAVGQDPKAPRVSLGFADGALLVSGAGDAGSYREELPIEFYGEPADVWLNPRYLLDGLGAVKAGRAALGLGRPKRPLLLADAGAAGELNVAGPFAPLAGEFLYLLMPAQPPV